MVIRNNHIPSKSECYGLLWEFYGLLKFFMSSYFYKNHVYKNNEAQIAEEKNSITIISRKDVSEESSTQK